jgi:hypothetical protein
MKTTIYTGDQAYSQDLILQMQEVAHTVHLSKPFAMVHRWVPTYTEGRFRVYTGKGIYIHQQEVFSDSVQATLVRQEAFCWARRDAVAVALYAQPSNQFNGFHVPTWGYRAARLNPQEAR